MIPLKTRISEMKKLGMTELKVDIETLEKLLKEREQRQETASAVDTIVSLPESVTDIRLQQWEQQENPFNGTEQKLKWLCELSDTCVLEGDWDMKVTGYGNTQQEAFEDAIQKWQEAS